MLIILIKSVIFKPLLMISLMTEPFSNIVSTKAP
jgi:hypothetical protein